MYLSVLYLLVVRLVWRNPVDETNQSRDILWLICFQMHLYDLIIAIVSVTQDTLRMAFWGRKCVQCTFEVSEWGIQFWRQQPYSGKWWNTAGVILLKISWEKTLGCWPWRGRKGKWPPYFKPCIVWELPHQKNLWNPDRSKYTLKAYRICVSWVSFAYRQYEAVTAKATGEFDFSLWRQC